MATATVTKIRAKESSSSNSPIYRLVGEKKEKPSVLKRVDFLTTADASNFILSFLGDGSIGEQAKLVN